MLTTTKRRWSTEPCASTWLRVGLALARGVAVAAMGITCAGCGKGEEAHAGAAASAAERPGSAPPTASPEQLPERVLIPASAVRVGTRLGRIRHAQSVESFLLSKYPTLTHEYDECVRAGACAPPSGPSGSCGVGAGDAARAPNDHLADGADRVAMTCVSHLEAEQFCRWAGGRLPSVAEWTLAVRGPEVRRHAWGDGPPTCKLHWRVTFDPDIDGACCGGDCQRPDTARVGQHPGGDSPFGVADVLAAGAEIIGPEPTADVPFCALGCTAAGLEPGAIDWFFDHDGGSGGSAVSSFAKPTAFRCVWRV